MAAATELATIAADDNPFSESQFRTTKYRPEFPDCFGCIQDSRAFCQSFFQWYNQEHRHSGVGLLTPAAVHYGQAEKHSAATPGCAQRSLPTSPGALRTKRSQTTGPS